MGYVETRKNQSQKDEDEKKPKWVSCPDIPDGLMTVDDEAPYRAPKEIKETE